MPNAHGPGITPVILQTLSFHDVTCQATLQTCLAPLLAIHLTTAGSGSLIQVFRAEDFSNAVLIPIPLQAIPAAYEGIRAALDTFPVAVAVLPGGIVVNGVRPGYQRAFMDLTGIEQWVRPANTPHRFLDAGRGPNAPLHTEHHLMRFAHAPSGEDREALVDTNGQVNVSYIRDALREAIGAETTATPVTAYCPESHAYRSMILVRVSTPGKAALAHIVSNGIHLSAAGHQFAVCPVTHVKPELYRYTAPGIAESTLHSTAANYRESIRG